MQYINGFGCYRYILSLLVLFHHLRLWIPLANTVDWGTHAVLGFFLISGYMIAAILDKSYADENRVIRFAINRLLRLLPAHWATLLFLVFTFLIVPESMLGWGIGRGAVNPLESYSWLQWAGNSFLVGNVPLLNFVTWTLRLELFLYIIALFVFSMNRRIALAGLGVGFATLFFLPLSEIGSLNPYSTGALACMFPFNMGMCIYYWRRKIKLVPFSICCLALVIALGFIVGLRVWAIEPEMSVIISVVLTGLAVAAIQSRRHIRNSRFKKIDQFFGDLSYSVYLIHKPVMIWIGWYSLTGHSFSPDSLWFVFCMVLFSHVLGFCINRYIERPVKRLRNKVRRQGKQLEYAREPA